MRRFVPTAILVFGLVTPAAAAPKVVATLLPVHGIVAAIMQGVGTPELLIDTPVSPHAYALTPSKRRLLEDADLVFGIGPTMETGIWDAVEEVGGDHVALMDFVDLYLILAAEETTHDDGGRSPHIWLDTSLVADLGEYVSRVLTDADPENAAVYLANASSFRATLAEVDASIQASLAGDTEGTAVSYHDAFDWFARQWEIDYDYVVVEPDLTPGAGRVAEIREQAAAGEIACLITEPQFRPDLLEALAADYDLRLVEIDPVGTAIAPGPQFYPELMRRVGAAFAECLGQ